MEVRTVSLRDASRAVRLDAVEKLPELLEKLLGKAGGVTDEVLDKVEAASRIASILTQNPS